MLHRFVFLSLALVLYGVATADNAAPPEPAGMKQLFNGQDLSGWDGDTRLWSVKDGAIRGETTEEKPAAGNTFLIWKGGTVKDFDLRLSFRCSNTNNSGIQYRSRHITDAKTRNQWVVRGYQHELRNENKLPSVAGFTTTKAASAGGYASWASRRRGKTE